MKRRPSCDWWADAPEPSKEEMKDALDEAVNDLWNDWKEHQTYTAKEWHNFTLGKWVK